MTSSATMLILLGVGAVLAIFLLLPSSAERTAIEPVPVQPVTSASMAAPAVDAGPDRTVGERETVKLSGEGYGPDGTAITKLDISLVIPVRYAATS